MHTNQRCDSPRSWHLLQCSHGSRVWLPRRCRSCTGCHNARRAKTLVRLHTGIDSARNLAFLTLTSTPGTDWPDIMRQWSHLVRWLRRTSPHLEYAAVKEEGATTGMKHLHVLVSGFLFTPQAKISAEWARLTGAWVINIQRPDSDKAAGYCAKYVSKNLDSARKNVTYSKGWPKLPPSEMHLVPLDEVGSWGPSKVTLWTDRGGIVDTLREACDCFGPTHIGTIGDHLWLKSLPGRSPPVSLAG